MKDPFDRICFLLAAADIKDRDIAEFLSRASISSISSTCQYISSIRQSFTSHSMEIAERHDYRPSLRNHFADEITDKIRTLLIENSGLTRTQAMEILSRELELRHPELPIPRDSRKGFHAWLSKLIEYIPESELLHIATQIRNRFVHDNDSDWRLK